MSVIYYGKDKCIEVNYVYTKNALQVAFRNICTLSDVTLLIVLSVFGVVLLIIIVVAVLKRNEIKEEIDRIRGQMNENQFAHEIE